jgi:hypothetical protein
VAPAFTLGRPGREDKASAAQPAMRSAPVVNAKNATRLIHDLKEIP